LFLSKSKRSTDINQCGISIIDIATGETKGPILTPYGKNAAAVALEKLGSKKGGPSPCRILIR